MTNVFEYLYSKMPKSHNLYSALQRTRLHEQLRRNKANKAKLNIKLKNGFAVLVTDNTDKWKEKLRNQNNNL